MNFKLLSACAGSALLAALSTSAQPMPPGLPGLPDINVQIVHTAPPPPRAVIVETRPAPPDQIWSDGYWDYRGSSWIWVDGRYVRPPEPRSTWVRPEYRRVDEGWRYVPAHWSNQRVIVETRPVKIKHDNGKHKGWKKEKHKGHDDD